MEDKFLKLAVSIYAVLLLIFFLSVFARESKAGTCSSISRTNNAANSVLTSTKYNSDLNTVYTQINALDGGCITDGTLEDGALNTTDFAVPLNVPHQGLSCSRSDAATISVSKGRLAVNGNWITDTDGETVTWGCGSCSAESTGTAYYVYATSATSLTLKISTTAPGADGYNSTDKVLCKFYNDGNGDIATESIANWKTANFSNGGYSGSIVIVHSPNGHGSTNTRIRRFASTQLNIGTAITYADSAANGGSFTINENGLYYMMYADGNTGGASDHGISVNSTNLTTNIESIPANELIARIFGTGGGENQVITAVWYLKSGDVVRAHTDSLPQQGGTLGKFIISKIGG